MPLETVLVTGAGGFIGGWLVETLYLNGSTNVRAGIRSWASAARLARFPVQIVACDVLDVEQINQAITGVTHVIHCAKGSSQVTIDGTRNMLDAALRQGVKRFVHISTTEVYGNQTGNIDETIPCQQTGHPYGDSKIEVENLCWEYSAQGLPMTIIRPPIAYGPFSKDWTVRLASKLQSGQWGIFNGYGEGTCNLIYVSDLVSGILLATQDERAVGQVFNMVGPELITWNQYFQRFNAILGLPELRVIEPRTTKLRTGVMEPARSSIKFALAHFEGPLRQMSQRFRPAKRLMRSVEKTMKSTPRPDDLSLFNRKATYLSTKSQALLSFQPRFDVEHGLCLTSSWLRHVGLAN